MSLYMPTCIRSSGFIPWMTSFALGSQCLLRDISPLPLTSAEPQTAAQRNRTLSRAGEMFLEDPVGSHLIAVLQAHR